MKFRNILRFCLAAYMALGTGFDASSSVPIDYMNESSKEYAQRMKWFVDAKFGIFIHFGLYSSLGGIYNGKSVDGYAEWIQSTADIASSEYSNLAEKWNPVNFNAEYIVKLAKDAGMKYLVVTTKHHEGFCLWDSNYTDFDIASTPMNGRDVVKELADACKKYQIRFGTYYSIIDWHHSSQKRNRKRKKTGECWSQIAMKKGKKAKYVMYMRNQIKELITKYDTDIMWFDSDWVDWWTMEDGKDLYQYIRSLKPSIIINNRVAKRSEFKKDFGTPEQEHPKDSLNYYWEACYTMNESWGYKAEDNKWKSADDIMKKLTEINANGGNLLLNVGPDGNGNIPNESVAILIELGKKLKN